MEPTIIIHGITFEEFKKEITDLIKEANKEAMGEALAEGFKVIGGYTMLNQKQAEAYTGLSETTLWRYRQGKTPLLHNYGEGRVNMFLQRELDKVITLEETRRINPRTGRKIAD